MAPRKEHQKGWYYGLLDIHMLSQTYWIYTKPSLLCLAVNWDCCHVGIPQEVITVYIMMHSCRLEDLLIN